jgi:arginyl-tRNA synthetase
MSDPIATITSLLQPVFTEMNDGVPCDPTVRPSDRADAQINGALPLAKRIGANPRELAQRIVDSACSTAWRATSKSPDRASST